MSRVRVTFFINSLEQGGAERQLAELLTRLDRTVFEPSLVVCIARDQLGYKLPVDRIRCLDAPMFPTPSSVLALERELRDLKTDVLHTYMGWENIFGRVAARRANVKAIVSSVRCTQLPRKHIVGEALTHKMADAIIVNSVGIRDELARRAHVAPERIDVVENGVDLQRFVPLTDVQKQRERKLWSMDGRRVLVMPGRICDQKNQKEVLRALVKLKHAGELPEDVRVLFAGRGSPPWYGEALRAYSTLSGLGQQVEFVGIVKQVEKLVAAADGMLLPSNYEGLPNAVIESMACGVPVIVSDAANTDSLVTDGKEGIVCDDNNAAGIAHALRRFFALGPEQLAAMGAAGHQHATTRFAVSRMVARTVDVYERVLGGLPRPEERKKPNGARVLN